MELLSLLSPSTCPVPLNRLIGQSQRIVSQPAVPRRSDTAVYTGAIKFGKRITARRTLLHHGRYHDL